MRHGQIGQGRRDEHRSQAGELDGNRQDHEVRLNDHGRPRRRQSEPDAQFRRPEVQAARAPEAGGAGHHGESGHVRIRARKRHRFHTHGLRRHLGKEKQRGGGGVGLRANKKIREEG